MNEINVLGNIIDTTFGKSSSPSGQCSVKAKLAGNRLTLMYSTIVNFASEQALRMQTERHVDEANQRLSSYVTDVKKQFKESAGRTLKLKELSSNDDIELISATSNSPRKIAYYRMSKVFDIL